MSSTQDWSVGNTVRVGFLHLTVLAKTPEHYVLAGKKPGQWYSFTPYCGLTAIAQSDAEGLIHEARQIALHQANQAIVAAIGRAEHQKAVRGMLGWQS